MGVKMPAHFPDMCMIGSAAAANNIKMGKIAF